MYTFSLLLELIPVHSIFILFSVLGHFVSFWSISVHWRSLNLAQTTVHTCTSFYSSIVVQFIPVNAVPLQSSLKTKCAYFCWPSIRQHFWWACQQNVGQHIDWESADMLTVTCLICWMIVEHCIGWYLADSKHLRSQYGSFHSCPMNLLCLLQYALLVMLCLLIYEFLADQKTFFYWAKLQNTGPLIYILFNHNSAFFVMFHFSKGLDTCKSGELKWPCIL